MDNLKIIAENQPAYDLLERSSEQAFADIVGVLDGQGYKQVYCVVIERSDDNHLVFFDSSIINDDNAQKIISYPIEGVQS